MRHRNPKAQWDSQICMLNAKQSIKKKKIFVRNKNKNILKCYVILVLIYRKAYWEISLQMKKLEITEK